MLCMLKVWEAETEHIRAGYGPQLLLELSHALSEAAPSRMPSVGEVAGMCRVQPPNCQSNEL